MNADKRGQGKRGGVSDSKLKWLSPLMFQANHATKTKRSHSFNAMLWHASYGPGSVAPTGPLPVTVPRQGLKGIGGPGTIDLSGASPACDPGSTR